MFGRWGEKLENVTCGNPSRRSASVCEQLLHGRVQLVRIERLGEEAVSAGRSHSALLSVAGKCADRDDWCSREAWILSKPCEHLQAALAGQHEVEEDEVRLLCGREPDGLHTVACLDEPVDAGEDDADQRAYARIVFAD